MHLKFHSNDLEGSELWKLSTCSVKVSLKYIEVFVYAESCLSGRAYIRRNYDTNLVEIHAEMSELLDKQVPTISV